MVKNSSNFKKKNFYNKFLKIYLKTTIWGSVWLGMWKSGKIENREGIEK